MKIRIILFVLIIGLLMCGCDTGSTRSENTTENTSAAPAGDTSYDGDNHGNAGTMPVSPITTSTTIGNGGESTTSTTINGGSESTTSTTISSGESTTSTTSTTIALSSDVSVSLLSEYLSNLNAAEEPYDIRISDKNPDLKVIYNALDANPTKKINLDLSLCTRLSEIGADAFAELDNLYSIIIPDRVTTIGDFAFYRCHNLQSINIPLNVTSVGDGALRECDKLDTIKTAKMWNAIDKSIIKNLTIDDQVTEISYGALSGCGKLENLTIPFVGANINIVETNESECFGVGSFGCDLKLFGYIFGSKSYEGGVENEVRFESLNSEWGEINYIPASLRNVRVNKGRILSRAFEGCNGLVNLTIDDGVTSINNTAFTGCSNLSYNIYENNRYLGNDENPYLVFIGVSSTKVSSCEINERCKLIAVNAFKNCTSLTSVVIPNGIKSFDNDIFYGCNALTDITIPNNLTSIGDRVFSSCWGLTNIIIPDSVTSIGEESFSYCSGLISVVIPDSVNSINSKAFYNCSKLETLTVHNITPPSFGSDMLSRDYALTTIYVPADSVETYKTASGWKGYADKIQAITE